MRHGVLRSAMFGVLTLICSLVTATMPAHAQEPFGTKLISGANWLGGQGVDVYSNGEGVISEDYSPPAVGMKWQCVELAQRLYSKIGWYSGKFSNVLSAYEIYDKAAQLGMQQKPNNGSYLPVPGDMIVHNPGSSNGNAGHVSIVDRVENNIVRAVEQNASSNGRADYSWNSSGLSRSSLTPIRGIVHDPDNKLTTAPASRPPFGPLDQVWRSPNGAYVTGWAIDPDTTGPIGIHTYVDGSYVGAWVANQSRPDVGAAFPGAGDNHGYGFEVGLSPGKHNICTYALDYPGGAGNPQLGCKPMHIFDTNNPVGHLDNITPLSGAGYLNGWMLDPNTIDPGQVHIYIDGRYAAAWTANQSRPDVEQVFPGYGSLKGFGGLLFPSPGWHNFCAYGINTGPGNSNSSLGCIGANIPPPAGYGHPHGDWRSFENAYTLIGRENVIGTAINNVHWWGYGCTQDFSGGSQSRSGIMQRGCIGPSYTVANAFWTYLADRFGAGNGVNVLGYPTNNAHRWAVGNVQDFDGGQRGANLVMIGDRVGRVHNVFGGIRHEYVKNGGAEGFLGYPVSEEYAWYGEIHQGFEGGWVCWRTNNTSYVVRK